MKIREAITKDIADVIAKKLIMHGRADLHYLRPTHKKDKILLTFISRREGYGEYVFPENIEHTMSQVNSLLSKYWHADKRPEFNTDNPCLKGGKYLKKSRPWQT